MNKYHIFGLMALTAVAFTSCEDDDSPRIQEPTEFVLNTPPFASQLYQLSPEGVIELTCSQPNYGLSLAPSYGVEISLKEDFGDGASSVDEGEENSIPDVYPILPVNPYSAVINISEADVAAGLCALRGITEESQYTDEGPMTVYVRATANINGQQITKINSNVVTLPQVQGYCAFASVELNAIYVPGNANGWNHGTCQRLLVNPNNESIYQGFLYINGEFKFTPEANWDAEWGAGENPGTLVTSGGGNLPLPSEGDGLYYVVVDTKNLNYTTTYIESVCVVGQFNGWDLATAPEMTHSEDYQTWTYDGDLAADQFKFVFNRSWDINLGGGFNNLVENGDNLVAPAGASVLTLDLHSLPYKAECE